MRYITLANTEADPEVAFVRNMLESAPMQSGYTIGQVRQATKLLDKIAKLEGDKVTLALEDADYAFVADRFQQMRFTVATPGLVKLADAIENAATEQAAGDHSDAHDMTTK